MGLLPQLLERLFQCPFDEQGHYCLHPTQCQALCFYFCSNLERFFGASLQPSTWNSSSSLPTRRRNSFYAFYGRTVMKLRSSRKVSKPPIGDQSSAIAILEELETAPNAIEEVLRVILDAENYVQACGNSEWWRTGISLGFMTEVRDVHLHDLMWCLAGLKLALQTVRGVELDSRAQFTRLNLAQCYAEMGEFSSPASELVSLEEQDNGHFNSMLQQANKKYDEMSFMRKMMMSTHENANHGLVQSLIKRLGYAIHPTEVDSSSPSLQKLPQSLCITSKDLLFSLPTHVVTQDRFSQVHEASWHGIKVAAKQFDYRSFKECFIYQVAVHAKLKYPFIIQLYGWSIDSHKRSCYLVFELVNDNLASLMKEKKQLNKTFHLPAILDLMLQLGRALEYSHGKGVLHTDITPYNVLVRPLSSCGELMEKGHGRVKLSNFGFTGLKLDESDIITLGYRAPEVWALHGRKRIEQLDYTSEADVYSFGMTFAYCLLGEDPFAGITSVASLRAVVQKGLTLNLPRTCPLVLKELVQNCLSKSLSARPTFGRITMVLRHLKLLLMKYRGPDELMDQPMIEREFFLSSPVISYVELCSATSDFSTRVQNISFHSIYRGVFSDGTKVLIQQMQGILNLRKLWLQTSQLLNLRHGNVAGLRAFCVDSSRYWFVFENCHVHGSLDKWLELDNAQEQLDVPICYKIVLGVACGLQYLHAQGIVYTVAAENILLDERHEPQLLVSSVQLENLDDDQEYHQRLDDVKHLGMLITRLLSYLIRNNIIEDGPVNDSQAYLLQTVENLCKSAEIDDVIEVLESVYDSCQEENLPAELLDAPTVNTEGSSNVMESCHESFTSFDLSQNLVEYIDKLHEPLNSTDSVLKSI